MQFLADNLLTLTAQVSDIKKTDPAKKVEKLGVGHTHYCDNHTTLQERACAVLALIILFIENDSYDKKYSL